MHEENRQLVIGFVEAYNSGNFSKIRSMLTEDATMLGLIDAKSGQLSYVSGRANVLERVVENHGMWENSFHIKDILSDEERGYADMDWITTKPDGETINLRIRPKFLLVRGKSRILI